jgi:hypothetical protein
MLKRCSETKYVGWNRPLRDSAFLPGCWEYLMAETMDLNYDLGTLLGPLDMSRVENVQTQFQRLGMPIDFDQSYLRHLSAYHGGVPKKRCFSSQSGRGYFIERFLNFIDHHQNPTLGWYNVSVTWTQIEDRLNEYLVPFAVLFAGDCLCFNYEYEGRPQVVVWLHEQSRQNAPVTDFVAANFDVFLLLLHEVPPS